MKLKHFGEDAVLTYTAPHDKGYYIYRSVDTGEILCAVYGDRIERHRKYMDLVYCNQCAVAMHYDNIYRILFTYSVEYFCRECFAESPDYL